MKVSAVRTRVLLLVEDNPGDAELVANLLEQTSGPEIYQVVHVPRMTEAVERLRSLAVDVVVLDLRLPDCSGVESVKRVREASGGVPIVVLTGTDDERVAVSCIDAGAQDYLAKSEIRAQNLRRAIGYAITRMREAQIRELMETLERLRAMSSATQGTSVTAALAGSGAIALRSPATFAALVDRYSELLEPFLAYQTERLAPSKVDLEHLITQLGDAGGGPRDLLDVHVAALDRATSRNEQPRSQGIVIESRLLALEMMGLLVDYYRVGHRRRFQEGKAS